MTNSNLSYIQNQDHDEYFTKNGILSTILKFINFNNDYNDNIIVSLINKLFYSIYNIYKYATSFYWELYLKLSNNSNKLRTDFLQVVFNNNQGTSYNNNYFNSNYDIYENMPELEYDDLSLIQSTLSSSLSQSNSNNNYNSENSNMKIDELDWLQSYMNNNNNGTNIYTKHIILPCQYCNSSSSCLQSNNNSRHNNNKSNTNNNKSYNNVSNTEGYNNSQFKNTNDPINNNNSSHDHNNNNNNNNNNSIRAIKTDSQSSCDNSYIYDPVYGVIPKSVWLVWQLQDIRKLQLRQSYNIDTTNTITTTASNSSSQIHLTSASYKKIRNMISTTTNNNNIK